MGKYAAAQQITDTVLTLQQCLDIGIKNNLMIKQTEAQMEATRIYWQQARENLLPSFNGDASQSFSQGRSLNPFTNGYLEQPITSGNYGLNGSLILSGGLTLQNSIRQTALAYQAGKMDLEQAKNTLTLNLIIAYLQVLSSEDQLEQAKTQLAVSEKQMERADVLNKEGAAPPQTFYDIKGQLAADKVSLITARNAVTGNKLNLLQMLNVPYNNSIRFQRQATDAVTGNYGETAQQIYNLALNNFALVKSGTLKRQSAEKGLKVAKGTLLPTLSLSGGLNTNYSSAAQRSLFVNETVAATGDFIETPAGRQPVYTMKSNYIGQDIGFVDQFRNNYSTNVRVGLRVPILNGFQNRNRIALAKLTLQTARDNEQANQVQLKVNIDQAYANMGAAFERYQLLQAQTEAFTESFRIAEARFNAGASTSVDFLVVKGKLDQTLINLINARYDYLIRTRILDYYQGKLAL
ncbi:TolC family protein [Mucilaginibacter calamicampi]|uniref:TolC family protein n=2 Tax=Mucilaginibacter calamicampi TaxID=1302352 RepID=A0ABW2YX97_9SPHI